MEIVSVLLIVVSGAALSSGFGRLILGWRYEVVVLATSVVVFGVGGLSLLVVSKFKLSGVVLTFFVSILLTFVFIKFNILETTTDNKKQSILGCLYWMMLLIIFSVSGVKASAIAEYIRYMYSLEENLNLFFITLIFTVVMGGFSMLMFIRECKQIER
jgi:hypothetical protein